MEDTHNAQIVRIVSAPEVEQDGRRCLVVKEGVPITGVVRKREDQERTELRVPLHEPGTKFAGQLVRPKPKVQPVRITTIRDSAVAKFPPPPPVDPFEGRPIPVERPTPPPPPPPPPPVPKSFVPTPEQLVRAPPETPGETARITPTEPIVKRTKPRTRRDEIRPQAVFIAPDVPERERRITAPLEPLVGGLSEAGKFVSQVAGFETFGRQPRVSPVDKETIGEEFGAIGRGITQIPAGIAGLPIFAEELIRRPRETIIGVGEEIREKPAEALIPLVLIPGLGRIKAPKIKVQRLVAVEDSKLVAVGKVGEQKVTGRVFQETREVVETAFEKTKPGKDAFTLEEVPGSPFRIRAGEITSAGEPVFLAVGEKAVFKPTKISDTSDFKITKAVPSKETLAKIVERDAKAAKEIPPAPAPIRDISAAAGARAERFAAGKPIDPAPTAPQLLRQLSKPQTIKTKGDFRPVIDVETVPGIKPGTILGITTSTSLSSALRQQTRQLETQRLDFKPVTDVIQKRGVIPITTPAVTQITTQPQLTKRIITQLTPTRLRPPTTRPRLRTPTRPIITTLIPGLPKRPKPDLLKKKPKRPTFKLTAGLFGKVKAPKAVLAPKALGLPDVVASFARRQEKVTPIGAVGAFRRTRRILLGR